MHGIKWITFHGHLDYYQKPPLGGRLNTKPLGDHNTQIAHNHSFVLFYHVWGPAWIEIHWNSIRFRARPVTYGFTLHLRVRDHNTWFWRCVGTMAFGHFLLALTISWSQLLACVRSSPQKSRIQYVVEPWMWPLNESTGLSVPRDVGYIYSDCIGSIVVQDHTTTTLW
jgi:hypothetical protein